MTEIDLSFVPGASVGITFVPDELLEDSELSVWIIDLLIFRIVITKAMYGT